MRSVIAVSSRRPLSRLAVMGVLAVSFVGCSADTSRFNSPNANPFASRGASPAESTGSVQAAPTSHISSQPLPPPTASSPATVASAGVSGGGQGFGSYTPSAAPAVATPPPSRDITGSIARPPAAAPAPHVAAAPAPAASPAGNVHIVKPGETLMSISRRYHKPLKQIADANHIPPHTHLKIGDRIIVPGHAVAVAAAPAPSAPAPAAKPAPQPAGPAVAAAKVPPPHAPAAATAPAAPKVTAEAAPTANYAAAGAPATADGSAGGPAFRWPLRGRVISGFPKNDGLDLAVPEGTAVHAAEDGVVAYAGNELKGYGNLILIRHSNGYVTAYAHASELMVKRNDPVRRGQVIAKSGQSGSVSSPQLHFEIRKGSTPVDPMQFLPAS